MAHATAKGLIACLLVATVCSARELIPFTRVGNLVVVDATLNGSHPLRFVVDTGAAHMVVDSATARNIRLPEGEHDTINGAGAGRVPVKKLGTLQMKLGGSPSRSYDFVATDLSGVSSIIGARIDGIIGYAFLRQWTVTVDYSTKQLEVRAPDERAQLAGEELPIRIENGWPFVRATLCVDDAHTVTDDFLIDSGSDDDVDHPLAREATSSRSAQTGNGLGKPVAGLVARAKSLKLGSIEIGDVTLASGGSSDRTSRIIGGGVLSRFTVTFDYPHSRIFLKR